MIHVEGAIRVLPLSVAYDSGELRAEENKTQPAVIQTLITENGVVQIIFPVSSIDQIVDGMLKMKEEAVNGKSDLYVPESAEVGIKQAEKLKQVTDELKS